MFTIKSAVHDIAHRWRFFGEALHLGQPSLNLIEETDKNPEKCLSSTLEQFLNKNYDFEKFGVPSWKLIVEAVGCKAGGNNKDLALTIAKQHSTTKGIIQCGMK